MDKQNAQFNQQGNLPLGTFDPRLFPSAQLPPVTQRCNATVNRRPTWLRFLRAFAVACLVVFLCRLFYRNFLCMIHYYRPPWSGHPGRPGSYPVPPHVTLERCVSDGDWSSPAHQPWPKFPLAATTTMELPLSAETLLLLSRSPMSTGSVDIVTSSQQNQDVATVEVVVSYFREDVRDQAKVCQILREDGAIGVGIFTREWPGRRRGSESMLQFATKVILPELSAESSPLLIKKFETDLPNTVHRVGDLNKKVLFQSLVLKGYNGRIDVESLQANIGIIRTSNAGIKGIFNTSTSMSLLTTNGAIDADVGLSSINASEPKVSLTTRNARITSQISLISDTNLGGKFHAVATTSNGQLDVGFPAAPPYSVLTFSGATSNARAAVSLNPAYEGSWFLQTSNSNLYVNQNESVVDPSGENRKRFFRITQSGHTASGNVYWKDATENADVKPAGVVSVRSSNARVSLDL